MKKTLLFLTLALSFACSQVNKPLGDADKQQIIGEVKVLIDTIIVLCEQPNAEGLNALYINSPDFVSLVGGQMSDYKKSCEGASNYLNSVISQKATIANEKYVVLDATTVLYTADSKWEALTKNDSIIIMDPVGMQFLLRKVDDQWKILSWTEEM